MTLAEQIHSPLPVELPVSGNRPLTGRIQPPGDKSISHRALLLAALSQGESRITGLADGADVAHTLRALRHLGAIIDELPDGSVRVTGGGLHEPGSVLDTGNSGTGIRLLAGIAAGLPGLTVLHGDESVARRPMDRIVVPLRLMGAEVDGRVDGRFPPLVVRGGQLHGITYDVPVSSAQVKSSILLAGLSADGPTVVREPMVSRTHTEEMLAARGADIRREGTTVYLGPSRLSPKDERVPADPSQAAFWITGAAAVPGSDVFVEGIYLGQSRGGFLAVLQRMGADIEVTASNAPVGAYDVRARGRRLHASDIEPAEVPGLIDEIPILAVAAVLADGVTRIRGAEELRVKETNRILSTCMMLRSFGAQVDYHTDGLTITGGAALHAADVASRGDHRIAMAAVIAALAVEGETIVHGMDAAATSYPSFLRDLASCTR